MAEGWPQDVMERRQACVPYHMRSNSACATSDVCRHERREGYMHFQG